MGREKEGREKGGCAIPNRNTVVEIQGAMKKEIF